VLQGCNVFPYARKKGVDVSGHLLYHSSMRSNTKAVIIWTENGCWFQQTVDGVFRSSFLGHIGTPEEVREWCESQAIDFATKFHAFAGTAVAEKWPRNCTPSSRSR
jgi:hypothetical protein